ncbi:MAG: Imidazoleglycerol-phosphate dehydratase [Bacteroidota bacterium]
MKKVLFIDRDGTIIHEPITDQQVDSYEKLAFLPNAISNLKKITQELDFELVMVTNQDGLGTSSFPEETFWPAHNKMLEILASEGIEFSAIHIDRSFPADNLPTRKPGIGMLGEYLTGNYDLANSFVLGDRETDVQLANNLGAKGIFISAQTISPALNDSLALSCTGWDEIYQFLKLPARKVSHERNTHETKIQIELNLDGSGKANNQTGLGFFDHMLDQIAKHANVDLAVTVQGDLHIDEHHTIEDTGIALGEAFTLALGDKRGINRYGFLLPMDECLAQVALDFSGRNWLVWEASFKREMIGEMPTEMFSHFFKSFSDAAKCNLNIQATGENEHHKIEAIFKAFAKTIRMAVERDIKNLNSLPSTKGLL